MESRCFRFEFGEIYSRPGNDLTYRFPLIVEALARLRPRSCIIDGEAAACGDLPDFRGRSPPSSRLIAASVTAVTNTCEWSMSTSMRADRL
jgi:hypothetical protein